MLYYKIYFCKKVYQNIMKQQTYIIGSRGSPLALQQTEIIANKLITIDPQVEIKTKIFKNQTDLQRC